MRQYRVSGGERTQVVPVEPPSVKQTTGLLSIHSEKHLKKFFF